MSLLPQSKITRRVLASLFAVALSVGTYAYAGTQTYVDTAVPSQPLPQYDRYDSPLKAGQLTLQDVLNAHKKTPAPTVAPLLPPSLPPTTAKPSTILAPSSQASSANVMLMQGMQSALQQNGSGKPTQLQAPQMAPVGTTQVSGPAPALQPNSYVPPVANGAPTSIAPAAATTYVPPAAADIGVAPGVRFEPGQEPKSLGGAIAVTTTAAPVAPYPVYTPPGVAPAQAPIASGIAAPPTPAAIVPPPPVYVPPATPVAAQVAPKLQPAPAAPAAVTYTPPPVMSPVSNVAPSPASAKGCVAHVETWSKTCAEAGYPATFIGKITGETRTVCPDNSLQDVWIANSCAPPETSDTTWASPNASASQAAPAPIPAAAEPAPSTAVYMPPVEAPAPVSSVAPTLAGSTVLPLQRADANCGSANGLAANGAPVSNLCSLGDATEVTGSGPWRWNCKGINGGMTVSCAAAVANGAPTVVPTAKGLNNANPIEDGVCGSANNVVSDHAPASELCVKGAASRVSGNGPWNWACSGFNGGTAAACSAPKRTDGACGSAVNSVTEQMPLNNLCTAGYASAVTGSGPWNWTCSGLNGGSAATCTVAVKRDAVCGSASLNGHREAPSENLCSVGNASSVQGGGPWNWSCSGLNGGSPVSCAAPASTNGVCGSANGVAIAHTPTDGLCSTGSATHVNGSGPWTWNCNGSDNGDTQSCTAPVVSRQQQQENEATAAAPVINAPAPAPVAAPAAEEEHEEAAPAPEAAVAPEPTPAPEAAPAPAARASSSSSSLCGGAAEMMALETPSTDLCKTGVASQVTGNGPYSWSCDDGAGHTFNCSTLSTTGSFKEAMTSNKEQLMPKAMPTVMTQPPPAPTKVPEMTAPKAKSMMAAPAPAPVAAPTPALQPAPSVATCGTSTGLGAGEAPTEGLCSEGKASRVTGTGPWRWTCVKGKTKASCEAPKQLDAACGLANGSVQKFAPTKSLCNSGTPTDVQGTGPWLWTCVGTGGGSSISCSAASQAQTRVDGSCGAAGNTPVANTPTVNLCDSGIPSLVYGEGPWTWTCSGLNGGVAISCSTQRSTPPAPPPPGPSVNGLCGSVNGVALTDAPTEGLCSTGTVTAVSGQGPWNWNCLGANGGMTVSCTSPLQPPAPITGVCGSGNGVPTLTIPRSGLCAAGISSSVSGQGPWTWSCSGTNGGGAVGCVAPLAGNETGSLPSMTTLGGEAPSPQASPMHPVTSKGLVTPRLPAGPLPPIKGGSLAPNPAFLEPPTPTAVPQGFAPDDSSMAVPDEPTLPQGASALQPPSISATLPATPSLTAPSVQGGMVPTGVFKLSEEISTIPFVRGSDSISGDMVPRLDHLSTVLLGSSGVRITLTAYSDTVSGQSPRDARRLSLARALAVRDYLTAKGISSSRIDVRALGANVPSGEPDRVDVKAN